MSDRTNLENNNLRLQNISNRVTNLPSYLNTADATATVTDIVEGMTAYVNNVKITGTIKNTSYKSEFEANALAMDGGYNNSTVLTYELIPTNDIVIRSNNDACYIYANELDVANVAGLTANVIKNGVTILGITGTLQDVDELEITVSNLENQVVELTAALNDKAGLTFSVPDGMKFGDTTLSILPELDTSNVINMSNMFNRCVNLTTVPNFDTHNVVSMNDMFYSCRNLTSIPNFNTSNVTSMANTFMSCLNLTTVPNLDTSNVISTARMFCDCTNLTTVPNLDTSNVTDMAIAFQNCYNLVDVPQLNTSNITNMRQTFCNCNNLSNESIQNIINMCLNSNITASSDKTLLTSSWNSPFAMSTINNSYYQNRWAELDAAGWTY